MGGITTITISKVKYIGIASLTIAILSVLTLNIISSYSSSKIESNAIDGNSNEVSTLANDSSSISLSFSNATGSCSDTSNPANVCMSIPDGGGIATGGHTVTVNTGSDIANYELKLSSKTEETALVNEDGDSNTTTTTIKPITRTYTSVQDLDGFKNVLLNYGLDNNWAYFVISEGVSSFGFVSPMTPASEPKTILDSSTGNTDSRNIYYGARVDHPSTMLAGNYTTQVVYTVTATLHEPTIASINPSTYELGSNEGLDSSNRLPVTIAGNHLSSTSRVYLTNSNATASNAGTEYDCTNIKVASDGNSLTCALPTDKTNSDLEAGDYNLTILADNGTAVLDNAFTYTKQTGSTTINSGTVSVDIDDSMIPVVYTGTTSTSGGKWTSVSIADLKADPTKWFDYTGASTNGDGSHWANAVTVENPENYRESGIDIPQNQIKGYWVYIPRYAYRVQRRNASTNGTVSAQNFDIVFETKDTPKKTPVACSGNYIGCSSSIYPNTTSQDDPLNSQTGWATHPAFTWGTEELNGFWIGKFETTGTRTAPTVKPNQHANVSEYIGEFYNAAKSIGAEDANNQYGGNNVDDTTSGLTPNSHHLAKATSHMLKNSEWGAVAYLSASKYGAGVNNVQINAARLTSDSTDADGDSSRYGVTGCGPEANGVENYYDVGTLNETIIESTTACGSADRAYNGTTGQYASTTNNVYGVYDMSGGALEYVMGSYTATNASQSSTSYFSNAAKPPYVDIYNITGNNSCTWNTNGSGCGGHALFETASWGGDYSVFANSELPWFLRGGSSLNGSSAGVFASSSSYGYGTALIGFRVALLVSVDAQ